jgi:hypothetical protein
MGWWGGDRVRRTEHCDIDVPAAQEHHSVFILVLRQIQGASWEESGESRSPSSLHDTALILQLPSTQRNVGLVQRFDHEVKRFPKSQRTSRRTASAIIRSSTLTTPSMNLRATAKA